ncbi:Poly polymerase central domain containing protein [Trichomonas vaginalis G3]|uniref:Poly(A) polymerase n=1 Tax=Trichomonas vaginalis (strain ATCC PRA-98 / G3) TaxID=412133 RepID=A2E7X0_TRIV3|nr:poly(A) polymerase family [Trichomonas vaginalis G3]EAY11196.1 Poly polymerase central domain containing protein [Trichomonas vaginalis G3]KAI5551429.1 poly(A) polymerase family [Trichomonas vaginalis G3]|eukprot:XP_001323419.1 Poly polymerase central domain containing protein [Trichomonas vaginalis G3]
MSGTEEAPAVDPAWIPLYKPVSEAEPTPIDIEASRKLVEFLDSAGAIADAEAMKHRQAVFETVSKIVDQFIEKVRVNKKMEPPEGEVYKGKLFYSGSYKLGVCSPKSDIDCVILAPQFVQKEEFFSIFYELLAADTKVKGLIKVEEAYVPIIKLTYDDIEFDISFAALGLNNITDDIDLSPDSVLENLSKLSVRALNSLRVNNMVIKLVPNLDNFKTLLKFVRYWAFKRGLYGNVYGYFGGVNLAILSAFVCQRYPTASPAMLALYFFSEISQWTWPTPIYINRPNYGELLSWDPTTESDHNDVMPIITPAYPSTNSQRSATTSSRNRIIQEMVKALQIMPNIITGDLPWSAVCEDHEFFESYKNYIEIDIRAEGLADYNWWKGTVISKVKRLITSLEAIERVKCAPIFPSSFDRENNNKYQGSIFIGLETEKTKDDEGKKVNPSAAIKKYLEEIYKLTNRPLSTKIENPQVINRKKIPDFCFPNGRKKKPSKKHLKKKSSSSEKKGK